MTSASLSHLAKTLLLCAKTQQTYKDVSSDGVAFDFDYSNSLLNYFTRNRNIDARNKIEMSVYKFIIFIVCNDVTALFFICCKDNPFNYDSNKTQKFNDCP